MDMEAALIKLEEEQQRWVVFPLSWKRNNESEWPPFILKKGTMKMSGLPLSERRGQWRWIVSLCSLRGSNKGELSHFAIIAFKGHIMLYWCNWVILMWYISPCLGGGTTNVSSILSSCRLIACKNIHHYSNGAWVMVMSSQDSTQIGPQHIPKWHVGNGLSMGNTIENDINHQYKLILHKTLLNVL